MVISIKRSIYMYQDNARIICCGYNYLGSKFHTRSKSFIPGFVPPKRASVSLGGALKAHDRYGRPMLKNRLVQFDDEYLT